MVESSVKIEQIVSTDKSAVNKDQKIVVWCGPAPNQKALVVKLSRQFTIVGIVIDSKKNRPVKHGFLHTINAVWDRIRFHPVYDAWKKLQLYYGQKFPSWPAIPLLRVAAINSPETENFTKNLSPDLIVVSGTGLIKEDLLKIQLKIGILNLHTGLSPYVKGGPNCTNWCIANNDWHLTGNTIMWINSGIDAGNIVTSEHVDISKTENLFEAQKLIMEAAHDLYIRAIEHIITVGAPYISVPQSSLGKGNLFLTKMWTAAKRSELLTNWKRRRKIIPGAIPTTIKLPDYSNSLK